MKLLKMVVGRDEVWDTFNVPYIVILIFLTQRTALEFLTLI